MQTARLLLLLVGAIGLGLGGMLLGSGDPQPPPPPIESPASLVGAEAIPEGSDGVRAALAKPVIPADAEAAGPKDMSRPKETARALAKGGTELRFEARALSESGLEEAIVKALLEGAELHHDLYKHFRAMAPEMLRYMDFFFAVWPDLGSLIAKRRIAVTHAPPSRPHPGPPAIVYHFETDTRSLTVSLLHEKWQVDMVFSPGSLDADSPHYAVFQEIK